MAPHVKLMLIPPKTQSKLIQTRLFMSVSRNNFNCGNISVSVGHDPIRPQWMQTTAKYEQLVRDSLAPQHMVGLTK